MCEKIVKFLVELPKKAKKLIPILRSSEAESVFKKIKDWFSDAEVEVDDAVGLLSSFFLCFASLFVLIAIILVCCMIGGF